MTDPTPCARPSRSAWSTLCARAATSSSLSSPTWSRSTRRRATRATRRGRRPSCRRTCGARLEAIGAETDVWEPEPTGAGNRFVPDDLDFVGRPQLAARLRGAGGGRSLLLNGHVDAVSAEPSRAVDEPPASPEVRDGLLYGRGSCDMKGGIGGMLFALETLRRLDVRLAGDVVFCTDTDEESSGAGAYACAAQGREGRRRPLRGAHGLRRVGRLPRRREPHGAHHRPRRATPSASSLRGATAAPSTPSRRCRPSSTRSARCERSGARGPNTSTPTCTRPTSCPPSSRAASGWSPIPRPAR